MFVNCIPVGVTLDLQSAGLRFYPPLLVSNALASPLTLAPKYDEFPIRNPFINAFNDPCARDEFQNINVNFHSKKLQLAITYYLCL